MKSIYLLIIITLVETNFPLLTLIVEMFELITSYLTSVFINPFRSKLVGIHHTRWFNNCHASISWTSSFFTSQ